MSRIIDRLLSSDEPAIRLKVLLNVMGLDPQSTEIQAARAAVASCPRVQKLLSRRGADGNFPPNPYEKWTGSHWTLATLADLGYPPGDESLLPMMRQVIDWLLSAEHAKHIRMIEGRVRRCASQEGNALYSMLALGLAQENWAEELAARLMRWQWPDGGWNCDKHPEAIHSSFHESLIPLRALSLYAKQTGDAQVTHAVSRAGEVFLRHHLYRRTTDGTVISEEFIRLHYPPYWHYDTLFALKVLAEAGFIHDLRCSDALDLLLARRMPDGGWPADSAYYRVTDKPASSWSLVGWGGVSKTHFNEFVTAEALTVLKAAGRLYGTYFLSVSNSGKGEDFSLNMPI